VHVPDPLSPRDDVVSDLAAYFAPEYRVLSISPRPGQPYQTQMGDVLATLDQFGFDEPIVVGERLGCVAALLLAAWHPGRAARLVLIAATFAALSHWDSVEARALRDCPPNMTTLRAAIQGPLLEIAWNAATVDNLNQFLQIP
jgi:pimeloyl-ACP methyl ester carboxylesterase